jgi:hypothetical protein
MAAVLIGSTTKTTSTLFPTEDVNEFRKQK